VCVVDWFHRVRECVLGPFIEGLGFGSGHRALCPDPNPRPATTLSRSPGRSRTTPPSPGGVPLSPKIGVFGGEEEGGGVTSGPGEARTILLLHIISACPSKQPLMVRTFLKAYIELGSYFVSVRTTYDDKRHHHQPRVSPQWRKSRSLRCRLNGAGPTEMTRAADSTTAASTVTACSRHGRLLASDCRITITPMELGNATIRNSFCEKESHVCGDRL